MRSGRLHAEAQIGQLDHRDARRLHGGAEGVVVDDAVLVLRKERVDPVGLAVDLERVVVGVEAVRDAPLARGVREAVPVADAAVQLGDDEARELLGGLHLIAARGDVREALRQLDRQLRIGVDEGLSVDAVLDGVEPQLGVGAGAGVGELVALQIQRLSRLDGRDHRVHVQRRHQLDRPLLALTLEIRHFGLRRPNQPEGLSVALPPAFAFGISRHQVHALMRNPG